MLNAGIPSRDKGIEVALDSHDVEVLSFVAGEEVLQVFEVLPHNRSTLTHLYTHQGQSSVEERDVLSSPRIFYDGANLTRCQFLRVDHRVYAQILHEGGVFTLEVFVVIDASDGMPCPYTLSQHTRHDVGRFIGCHPYEEVGTVDVGMLKVGE